MENKKQTNLNEKFKNIVNNLRDVRKHLELSQENVDMATKIHIAHIESFKRGLTLHSLDKLLNYYDIKYYVFFMLVDGVIKLEDAAKDSNKNKKNKPIDKL